MSCAGILLVIALVFGVSGTESIIWVSVAFKGKILEEEISFKLLVEIILAEFCKPVVVVEDKNVVNFWIGVDVSSMSKVVTLDEITFVDVSDKTVDEDWPIILVEAIGKVVVKLGVFVIKIAVVGSAIEIGIDTLFKSTLSVKLIRVVDLTNSILFVAGDSSALVCEGPIVVVSLIVSTSFELVKIGIVELSNGVVELKEGRFLISWFGMLGEKPIVVSKLSCFITVLWETVVSKLSVTFSVKIAGVTVKIEANLVVASVLSSILLVRGGSISNANVVGLFVLKELIGLEDVSIWADGLIVEVYSLVVKAK